MKIFVLKEDCVGVSEPAENIGVHYSIADAKLHAEKRIKAICTQRRCSNETSKFYSDSYWYIHLDCGPELYFSVDEFELPECSVQA